MCERYYLASDIGRKCGNIEFIVKHGMKFPKITTPLEVMILNHRGKSLFHLLVYSTRYILF